MAPRHAVSIATVLMMAIFFSFSATAYEVYRWVDEDGVPHFSQWKPEHSAGVTTLRITATNPPEYDPSEDPYSIRKQAQRTNTVWTNMEQRRAARNARQLEAAERAARTVLRPVEPVQYYAASVFFRPIHHSKFFRHRQHHIKKVRHHQLFELDIFNDRRSRRPKRANVDHRRDVVSSGTKGVSQARFAPSAQYAARRRLSSPMMATSFIHAASSQR